MRSSQKSGQIRVMGLILAVGSMLGLGDLVSQLSGWPVFEQSRVAAATPQEDFEAERKKISDTDYNKRYQLANKFYQRAQAAASKQQLSAARANLDIAEKEVKSILAAKSDHLGASLLKPAIVSLRKKVGGGSSGSTPVKPPTKPDKPPVKPVTPKPGKTDGKVTLLTKDQINLIKVYEVDTNKKPRVNVPSKTIDALFTKYRDSQSLRPYLSKKGRAKFKNLKGWQQLNLIFDAQARDLYGSVKINTVPKNISTFKARVHNGLLQRHCGRCHGGGKAKGLYVIKTRATSDETVYTNLMILRRTQSGGFPLIYTTAPEKSPLIQFALPPDDAMRSHPKVNGRPIKPFFRGINDPQYKVVKNWIGGLYGEQDDYPIAFQPPGGSKAKDKDSDKSADDDKAGDADKSAAG